MSTLGELRSKASTDGSLSDHLLTVPGWGNEVVRRYAGVVTVIAEELGITVGQIPSVSHDTKLGPKGQVAFDTMYDDLKR